MSRTDEPDVPPRPGEILDETPHQHLPDLDEDEYRRLAENIRASGVNTPILVDDEGNILDGHHRAAIAEYYDIDYDTKTLADLDDVEKVATALANNLSGREANGGIKREAVKRYIKAVWPKDEDGKVFDSYESNKEVATKLGVSRKTVQRARRDLGKSGQLSQIPQARYLARKYLEENPDASDREVGREVGVDHKTVAHWSEEDFEDESENEGSEESEPEPEPEDGAQSETEDDQGREPEPENGAQSASDAGRGG